MLFQYEICKMWCFSITLKRLYGEPLGYRSHSILRGLDMSLREVEMEEGYLHMHRNCAENSE